MMLNGKTDVGKRRRNNQDSFVIEHFDGAGTSLALVCDGMGGANGGNIASSVACEEFVGIVKTFLEQNGDRPVTEGDYSSMLAHAVASANNKVFRRAESDTSLKGMGTTLVCALVAERSDTLYAVNVGDSRLYLFANGHLRQITHDHSLVQYLQDSGRLTAEEAKTYPNRNVITRAIGIERTVDADIFSVDRISETPGVLLLLCSDGLCGYVDAEVIEKILKDALAAPAYDGDAAVEALVNAANDAGGADNITAILINPSAKEKETEKGSEPETEASGTETDLADPADPADPMDPMDPMDPEDSREAAEADPEAENADEEKPEDGASAENEADVSGSGSEDTGAAVPGDR